MKQKLFQNNEDWLEARRGKITGSRLKEIAPSATVSKEMIMKELDHHKIEYKKTMLKDDLGQLLPDGSFKKLKSLALSFDPSNGKSEYYNLIAEFISIPSDGHFGEKPMDRGHRCEPEAIERFRKETGKKGVDDSLVMWMHDEDDRIAVSPDAFIGSIEAIEVKCLASGRHVEALLTKKIPPEYELQVLQYFLVNESLEELHFVFYDPRIIKPHDFFYLTFKREELKEDIATYLKYEQDMLKEVEEIVAKLSF